MAKKDLLIRIIAEDQGSASLRRVGAEILGLGGKAVQAGTSVFGLGRHLFSLKTVAVGVGAALIGGSFKRGLDELDSLNKLADRTELSVEALSELRYIAGQAGTDFEQLANVVGQAQKRIGEFAATGKGEVDEAMQRLGVRLRDVDGNVRSFSDLLPELIRGFEGVADEQERMFLATQVFGRAGGGFLNFLNLGADNMRVMAEQARRLGVIFTPEQAASAERINDAIDRVGQSILGLKAKLATELDPFLTSSLDDLASFIAAVPKMVGTAAGTISDALGGDGVAIHTLSVFGQRGVELLGNVGYQGGKLLIFSLAEVVLAGGSVLGEVGKALGLQVASGFADSVGEVFEFLGSESFGFRSDIAKTLSGIGAGISGVAENYGKVAAAVSGHEISAAFNQAMIDMRLFDGAWASTVDAVTFSASAFLDAADDVFKYSEALADTSLSSLEAVTGVRNLNRELEKVPDPTSFAGGWAAGWGQLYDQTRAYGQLGTSVAQSVGQAFGPGLATHLIAAARGTENLNEAMQDFIADTLAGVSQLIVQFLILRAVSGLLGGFGGKGAPISEAPIDTRFNTFFANRGGWVRASAADPRAAGAMAIAGVPGYLFGGGVGGSGPGRDSVLARLAPGEFVVSGRGARAQDHGMLDYINRGGRVQPAGSGGMVFNSAVGSITVHVHGGGGDAKAIGQSVERAVVQAVTDALRRNPGFRQTIREVR